MKVAAAIATGTDGAINVAFSPKSQNSLNALVKKAEGKAGPDKGKWSVEVGVELAKLVVDGVGSGGKFAWAYSATFKAALPTIAATDVAAIIATAAFPLAVVGGLFATVAVASFLMGSIGAFTLLPASIGGGGGGDDMKKKCGTPDEAVSPSFIIDSAGSCINTQKPFCKDPDCKGDNTKRNQKCTSVRGPKADLNCAS